MSEENKPRKQEAIIKVSNVELRLNQKEDIEEVTKIIFTTDRGRITHTPKAYRTIMRKGIGCSIATTPTIENIPEIVFDLNEAINKNNIVSVQATYMEWDKTRHTYYFVQGKQINDWQILGDARGSNEPSQ